MPLPNESKSKPFSSLKAFFESKQEANNEYNPHSQCRVRSSFVAIPTVSRSEAETETNETPESSATSIPSDGTIPVGQSSSLASCEKSEDARAPQVWQTDPSTATKPVSEDSLTTMAQESDSNSIAVIEGCCKQITPGDQSPNVSIDCAAIKPRTTKVSKAVSKSTSQTMVPTEANRGKSESERNNNLSELTAVSTRSTKIPSTGYAMKSSSKDESPLQRLRSATESDAALTKGVSSSNKYAVSRDSDRLSDARQQKSPRTPPLRQYTPSRDSSAAAQKSRERKLTTTTPRTASPLIGRSRIPNFASPTSASSLKHLNSQATLIRKVENTSFEADKIQLPSAISPVTKRPLSIARRPIKSSNLKAAPDRVISGKELAEDLGVEALKIRTLED